MADSLTEPQSYRAAIRRRVSLADVWRFVVTLLVLLALLGVKHALDKIEDGRRNGTETTCAIASAVVASGRHLVEGSGKQHFSKQAEDLLGFPPLDVRETQAREEGQAYVQGVSEGIVKIAGLANGAGLLKPDGTVDCRRLREVAHIHG